MPLPGSNYCLDKARGATRDNTENCLDFLDSGGLAEILSPLP